ncbi:MAG TPA: hypothetical protein VJB16_07565 [archaeon]|nr:hypothetical protein [archaeon]
MPLYARFVPKPNESSPLPGEDEALLSGRGIAIDGTKMREKAETPEEFLHRSLRREEITEADYLLSILPKARVHLLAPRVYANLGLERSRTGNEDQIAHLIGLEKDWDAKDDTAYREALSRLSPRLIFDALKAGAPQEALGVLIATTPPQDLVATLYTAADYYASRPPRPVDETTR